MRKIHSFMSNYLVAGWHCIVTVSWGNFLKHGTHFAIIAIIGNDLSTHNPPVLHRSETRFKLLNFYLPSFRSCIEFKLYSYQIHVFKFLTQTVLWCANRKFYYWIRNRPKLQRMAVYLRSQEQMTEDWIVKT